MFDLKRKERGLDMKRFFVFTMSLCTAVIANAQDGGRKLIVTLRPGGEHRRQLSISEQHALEQKKQELIELLQRSLAVDLEIVDLDDKERDQPFELDGWTESIGPSGPK